MIKNSIVTLEQEILSGLIQNNKLIIKCDSIKIYMFQLQEHREIYKAILEMLKKDMSVDLVNLLNYIDKNTRKMGGITYISEVASCSISEVNFETKVKLLIEEYKKTEMLNMAKKVQNLNNIHEMAQCINNTLEKVYKSDVVKEIDISNVYEEYLNELYSDSDKGFKTGLYALDDTIGNLQRGRLITLFARSGIGKSTIAIQIASNLIFEGYKVMYGSGEMSNIEVLNKIAASKLNIEYKRLSKKQLTDEEKEKVLKLINFLVNKDFYVSNETNIDKLISEARLYKLKNKLDVLFVDYVNKYIDGVEGFSLSEKIGQVTAKLKTLALQEKICVVLLAQANRRTDINDNKGISEKITNGDIQDSARIEQDSDQVIAIYRNLSFDNKTLRNKLAKDGLINYSSKNADKNPECVNLTILKNRHGEKNTLAFRWQGEYSKVSNFMR